MKHLLRRRHQTGNIVARRDFPVVLTCVLLSHIRASRENPPWLKGYLLGIGLLPLLIPAIFKLLCVISPFTLYATIFSHHRLWNDLHVIHTRSLSLGCTGSLVWDSHWERQNLCQCNCTCAACESRVASLLFLKLTFRLSHQLLS